jgi:hypothetical protein
MKTKILIRLAIVASFAIAIMQSCSKDDEQISTPEENTWTVRPDFATLDTRPPEVIAKFQVTKDLATPAELSKLKAGGKYALVIGISDYAGFLYDLQYCDDDAIDWKNRLQTEGYEVTLLTDRDATKSTIEAEVSNLASLSVAGNEIAFCYSGHGSSGNIISRDLYYISSSWFETIFANAASAKMMFCFDACQIGAMKDALCAPGRIVAVASDTYNYSYDGDWSMQNGVFTYYQMEGFDDLNYIYLEPDCDYAIDQMEYWAMINGVDVAPSYCDSYPGDFDL